MLKTKLYINGCGAITPQSDMPDTADKPYLSCVEPEYKTYIDPMVSRRMSRIMKMGLVAAKLCLKDAAIESPEAIITGTGLGCIEDTEKFMSNMIVSEEKMLNPTPFIQSTHNTIGAQIAMNLKCNGYNNTFVHRGHSFESALTDAILYAFDYHNADILVGGFDELTKNAFRIMQRLRLLRNTNIKAGEGAVFFVLNAKQSANSYACLQAIDTFTEANNVTIEQRMSSFLSQNNISITDIDVLLCGSPESLSEEVTIGTFMQNTTIKYYKQLCGEYHTASAFALQLAAKTIKHDSSIKRVLIWNNYLHSNHSFILLSSC